MGNSPAPLPRGTGVGAVVLRHPQGTARGGQPDRVGRRRGSRRRRSRRGGTAGHRRRGGGAAAAASRRCGDHRVRTHRRDALDLALPQPLGGLGLARRRGPRPGAAAPAAPARRGPRSRGPGPATATTLSSDAVERRRSANASTSARCPALGLRRGGPGRGPGPSAPQQACVALHVDVAPLGREHPGCASRRPTVSSVRGLRRSTPAERGILPIVRPDRPDDARRQPPRRGGPGAVRCR